MQTRIAATRARICGMIVPALQKRWRLHYNLCMPESWFDLAGNARRAASRLAEEHFRSCLARAYYAAYSKVTHDLSAVPGVTVAADREGPKHPGESGTGGIHRLIRSHMPEMSDERRAKLAELIGRLYTLRCFADYRPSVQIDGRDAREAVSIMNTVFDAF